MVFSFGSRVVEEVVFFGVGLGSTGGLDGGLDGVFEQSYEDG